MYSRSYFELRDSRCGVRVSELVSLCVGEFENGVGNFFFLLPAPQLLASNL
ncbi:hypothetical protein SAMN06265171_111130 [Chryseobacterium rhizoplanae]|uniref:Uncharacterized protein n=1 Tax=Chryseobacterium rhizoplanae TaxID=1609531 RepID=A0A521F429_9FLAO|nr:hypothetical protein SAMN06265171_111130 [Chryseobacterium rhizoplanae]